MWIKSYGKKIHFRENWRIFLGIWGVAELILRIFKKNTFRELKNFLSGDWGDQCIIFRDQGRTDPTPGRGASLLFAIQSFRVTITARLAKK